MTSRPFCKKPSPPSTPIKKNLGTFTHFMNIPLIQPEVAHKIQQLQNSIYDAMTDAQKAVVSFNNPDWFHITLGMLVLPKADLQQKAKIEFENLKEDIKKIHNGCIKVNLKNVGCFRKPYQHNPGADEYDELSLIYLNVSEDELYQKLETTCHMLIKKFIQTEVVHEDDLKSMNIRYRQGFFKPEKMHITLFRVREQSYQDDSGKYVKYNWRNIFEKFADSDLGQAVVPNIDISIRCTVDENKYFQPLAVMYLGDEKKAIKEDAHSEEKESAEK